MAQQNRTDGLQTGMGTKDHPQNEEGQGPLVNQHLKQDKLATAGLHRPHL